MECLYVLKNPSVMWIIIVINTDTVPIFLKGYIPEIIL